MDINQRIAIDPGTKNTRLADVETGEIIEEPTLAAAEYSGEVVAVGRDAEKLLTDLPGKYLAAFPMSDGFISDIDLFDVYIRMMIKKLRKGKISLFPPKAFVAVPAGITDMQKNELRSAVTSAAVRDVVFIEKPLAAAIGADDALNPHASLVLSLGAGAAEAAVVYMGRIISHKPVEAGGDGVDSEIIAQLRKSFDIIVGKGSAEKLKKEVGITLKKGSTTICARSIATGFPTLASVENSKISCAVAERLTKTVDSVKPMLAGMPGELYADIMKGGVMITGGGAHIAGIGKFFEGSLKMPVCVDGEPELSVIRGAAKAAASFDEKRPVFKSAQRELSQY